MIILDLIYNISVLVALSVLSGFINSRYSRNSLLSRNLQGLLFGVVAIIGMLYPFNLTKGIIFDGRSIVISLCTLFFGPLSGLIASTITIIFRNIIGGEGAWTGSLVIISSFLIGLLFYGLRSKKRIDLTNLNLYIFGFIVSAAMMFFMITLPKNYMLEALNTVTLTVMIFYPLITLLIGKVLFDQEENRENINRISEERNLYKTTVYSIGDGLIVTDKSGKIVQMNQIAENLIELKEKEAIGQPLITILTTIQESEQGQIEDGILKDPVNYLSDKTHRKLLLVSKSGKEIPISLTQSPIKNSDGSIKGEVIVFSDQTSEIEQQIAVSESEQRFRSIVEGTSEPMFIQSSGKFIYLNPAALKLFGANHSSELIDKPVLERFHPDFHNIIKERIRIINEERKSISNIVELKCIKVNGDEIWVETSGEPIVFDKKNSALVFIRDITERKRIIEKLKASDRIFEHALDLLCIASFDGYFKVLNPSWTNTLGWSIDELLSRPWKEFLHPSDLSYTSSIVENIVRKNEIIQFENRYICKDGSYRWLSWRVIPYPEEEVIYGVARDVTLQKNAEHALHQSEEKFRKVFMISPDSIVISRLDNGHIVLVNETFKKISGFSEKEALGKNSLEFNIWENSDDRTRFIKELTETGFVENYETKFRMKNGRIHYGLISATIIELEDIKYILSIIRDITNIKTAEELLSRSEKEYKNLFQNAHDVILILDPEDETILLANKRAFEIYKCTDQEFIGKSLKKFSKYPERGNEKIKELFTNRTVTNFETVQYDMSGEELYFDVNASLIEYEGKPAILSLNHDITARKKAEIALRESEEKLLSIFNTAPTGIGVTINRIVTEVNQKICDMTGYTKEELIGKSTRILYASNEEFELVGKAKYNKSRPEVAAVIETQWIRKDGHIIDVLLAAIPIVKDDFTKGITFTALDITEKKKNEKELNQYRKHLEQIVEERTVELDNLNRSLLEQLEREKELEEQLQIALSKEKEINELKTRFIATVSHEFRTPLASLLSSSQMIQRYSSRWTEEKLNDQYNRISSTVQYLTQLLDDVLTISRADREILTNNPEKINISEQLNLFYQELESYLKENHKLVFNYLSKQESISIDKKLFRQIIINLLTNAIKYSPQGGKIELIIDYNEEHLNMTVMDEGMGIAEDEIKFIFDPFYRTKNSIGIQGSGLGLNIVLRSVEILDGKISVESKLNSGTKFNVRIPIYE